MYNNVVLNLVWLQITVFNLKVVIVYFESVITLDILDQLGKMVGFKISCHSELLLPSVEFLKYYGRALSSGGLFTDATCRRNVNVIITKSPLVY